MSDRATERRQQLHSLDLFEDYDGSLIVLDRSTLEAWANCPTQAKMLEKREVHTPGFEAVSGIEVHKAISRTICHLMNAGGEASPQELKDTLWIELRHARPDVQPDALNGCAASVWAIASLLAELHPHNILRFDGGEEYGKSGQLAMDFEGLGVRATSEVDLLYSGESVELLHAIDWKSGHKIYDTATVKEGFQFQQHAALVFVNYPKVDALDYRVFNTRIGKKTYGYEFERRRMDDYVTRIRSAIEARQRHYEKPPIWPEVYKCSICSCAANCPGADAVTAFDPIQRLTELVALEAKSDALKKQLADHVDANGGVDIKAAGVAFGRNRPASTRRKSAELYETED